MRAVLAWHYPSAAGQPPVGLAPASVRSETETIMQGVLDEAVARAFPDRPAAEVETRLGCGRPAQVLIDESKEADLLVVGSCGPGAFTGMLVGSVSIHCVTVPSARSPWSGETSFTTALEAARMN